MAILTYHRIAAENAGTDYHESASQAFYTLTADRFTSQLSYLKENKFEILSLFGSPVSYTGNKSVILTFDDGHESDFTVVLPLLKKFGFTAAFFICLEYIGKSGYMNWQQIRALADAGMSVQCHGLLHRDYSKIPEQMACDEFRAARLCLERNLSQPVLGLALPGGFADGATYQAGFDAGFSIICNSEQRVAKFGKVLNRFVLRRSTTMKEFVGIVHRKTILLISLFLRRTATKAMKSLVGQNCYEAIKCRLAK